MNLEIYENKINFIFLFLFVIMLIHNNNTVSASTPDKVDDILELHFFNSK